ncbi:MAG: ABC-type multidrug transport system fused ATPase/permease subunit [Francisella sp.]|jgi:ABC-type multidrug transport system fused ATPase/permease subunit
MLYSQIKTVLKIPKHTVYSLIIYSLLLGFLSLTIPVSVQTLVNLVGVSLSVRPVISLITILSIFLIASFFVRIFQLKLVEQIQRKIFVETIIRIVGCIYRVDFNSLKDVNIREKLNRVFELKVLQKSVSIIFMILLDIFLQTLFCVIILAFYHPMFLVFDIMLVVCIFLSIFLPLRAGYEAGLKESSIIYDIAGWFEEKTSEFLSFRQRPMDKSLDYVDTKLCTYLEAREDFFKVMLRQHIYIGLTYIFMNILLLGIGSYLIVKGQLSIGQLIAAELLVNIVLLGLLKFSQYLNDCYGFLVGVRKIRDLLEISQEENVIKAKIIDIEGDVKYLDININENDVYNIDFTQSKIKNIILPVKVAQSFLNGLFDSQAQEVIKINKICIRNYCKETVGRDIHIASGIEIIAGSVLDNLYESEHTVEMLQQLDGLLETFDIKFLEKCFDKKIDSQKIKYDLEFDTLVVLKMNIVRAILKSPKLLVLIDSYGLARRNGDKSIIQILENLDIATLVVSIK